VIYISLIRYTAVFARQGSRTKIEIPACPGYSTFAESNENALAVAKQELERYLEAVLRSGERPPEPSADSIRPGMRVQPIPVSRDLAKRLRDRWLNGG